MPKLTKIASFLIVLLGAALMYSQKPYEYARDTVVIPCGEQRCNIVLIVIDTLAASHMKAYGYDRDTLPETEKMLASSVRFEKAYSVSPWTLPSFSSFQFSRLPNQLSYHDLVSGEYPSFISALRENGYTIARNYIGPPMFIHDTIQLPFKKDELHDTGDSGIVYNTPPMVQKLEEASRKGKPFFALIHTFQVHDPYRPIGHFLNEFEELEGWNTITMGDLASTNASSTLVSERKEVFRLRYDQQIRQVDAQVAELLRSITPQQREHTIVILTSDHGEQFGEHGKVWHSQSLHTEETHIPLYIAAPYITSKTVHEPVSLLDIGPTILSIARIPIPASFSGVSLVHALETGVSQDNRAIPQVNGKPYYLESVSLRQMETHIPTLAEFGAEMSTSTLISPQATAIRKGRWFLQRSSDGWTLYDTQKDPMELSPISTSFPFGSWWTFMSLRREYKTFFTEPSAAK